MHASSLVPDHKKKWSENETIKPDGTGTGVVRFVGELAICEITMATEGYPVSKRMSAKYEG